MKLFSLVQTKYYQFEQAVKGYLSQTLSKYGSNYGSNTIFGQLINVLGATVQNIMLYIEDSLVEQNKYTAQRKKSIYGLAAMTGYQPSTGQAAGVMLEISYAPTNERIKDVFIYNKEKIVCSQNGLTYSLLLPQEVIVMSIDRDVNSRYIYAAQGTFETQKFVSTGGKYYTQNFSFQGNIDTKYMSVSVNGEPWTYVDSFYDMDPGAKQWTYQVSMIGGIDLIFGNGKFGAYLYDGDQIEVTYLLHDGEAGNLDSNIETYFVFNDPLSATDGSEVDGNALFNVTFASNDAVTSGANSESVSQVSKMIGLNSRSLVLADPKNYNAVLNKFSFVGYNRSWSEQGSMVINSLIMKNYASLLNDQKTYFDLTEGDFKLSPMQKVSIQTYIQNSGNQLAGTSYNIFDPEICKYAMYVYLKFSNQNYEKEYVQNLVRTVVAAFFTNLNSDKFIPKSDIIQLLKNYISNLEGVDIYFLSERNETALQEKKYVKTKKTYNPSTGAYNVDTSTVYLYDGENPNLGLDNHGNIFLDSDEQFPVLMGGWDYLNQDKQEVTITDPLIIIFE